MTKKELFDLFGINDVMDLPAAVSAVIFGNVAKEYYDQVTKGKVIHATKEEWEAENN